jgi:Apea-like HEPN
MASSVPDKDALPLYGCVTGIMLPVETHAVAPGITLRRGVFEMFSAPMLAFKEVPPGSHSPGPWVAVHGGFGFKSRAELAIVDLSALDGFSPSQAAWLIAALLRLRIDAPVRIAAVANIPLAMLPKHNDWALAFEAAPYHIGLFRSVREDIKTEDLEWLSETLPVAARLYHEERFMRGFSIFDESVWSGRVEMGTVLIWTAIEILFDLSGELHKTKAICSALSEHVASDAQDRDRAYNVIRELYEKRGRIVHAGREIEAQDFGQSFALARAAFMNVLGRRELPKQRTRVLQ